MAVQHSHPNPMICVILTAPTGSPCRKRNRKEDRMKRSHSLGLLFAAVGVLLMLAIPSLAAAKQRDRNHDGIPDRWEKRHHLSTKVNQARRDQDRDHLRNLAEFEAGTNPRNPDTNGNGIPDGEEHAGKIASFDTETGRLVIDLFGGDTVSGLVTEETEIECGGQKGASASSSDSGDEAAGSEDEQQGEEPGDDGGQEESGDDEGDQEEAGDDEGQGSNCSTADLEVGAVVHEAELQIEEGSAVFEKVELAG
jgi:cobalamin biosynthesis protein CobT